MATRRPVGGDAPPRQRRRAAPLAAATICARRGRRLARRGRYARRRIIEVKQSARNVKTYDLDDDDGSDSDDGLGPGRDGSKEDWSPDRNKVFVSRG